MTQAGGDPTDRTARLRDAVALTPVGARRGVFVLVDGPEAGKTVRVDDAASRRLLIGQSPVCDIRLADKAASRRHAAVELDGDVLRITDLDSTNGTFVNGIMVKEAVLRGGELIVVGNTAIQWSLEDSATESCASTRTSFGRTLGASPAMRLLYPLCERVAASDIPVLIEGETGTGKELLAESLHEASPRAEGPFVVFDCTTISPQLLEGELFGHVRGAFTGADADRQGLFEAAHGGTLFIDEIGDLDLALQAKLLRAVERHEIRRVGGSAWTKVDVRIVAATRRDLDREIQARRFRDDLFFRLAVARLELPPLRKRTGDIALLTRCFCVLLGREPGELPPSVLQRFERHGWPGNVRELYNAVARQLALGEVRLGEDASATGTGTDPTDFIDGLVARRVPLPQARQQVRMELERRYVERMLEAHGGNVARAAAECGIGRRYFQMLKAKV